jgi:hypothetical protein
MIRTRAANPETSDAGNAAVGGLPAHRVARLLPDAHGWLPQSSGPAEEAANPVRPPELQFGGPDDGPAAPRWPQDAGTSTDTSLPRRPLW